MRNSFVQSALAGLLVVASAAMLKLWIVSALKRASVMIVGSNPALKALG
jgi:hypothetical protein